MHDLRQKLQSLTLLQGMLAGIVKEETAQELVAQLEDVIVAMSASLPASGGNGTRAEGQARKLHSRHQSQRRRLDCGPDQARTIESDISEYQPAPIIFVVDDEESVCESICAALETHGYSTKHYANGSAFLKAYSIERNACLLVDACMPGMNGLELIAKVSAFPKAPRIIMMTAHGDVKMAVAAMKAGAIDFLEKPFQKADLHASIERALSPEPEPGVLQQWRLTAQDRIGTLTPRQRQVLDCLLLGRSSKFIAGSLSVSQRTIENHRAAIIRKTGAGSLAALLRMAVIASSN
jgi:FixJ family two-component response regulator